MAEAARAPEFLDYRGVKKVSRRSTPRGLQITGTRTQCLGHSLIQQRLQIKSPCIHRQPAILRARPLFFRAVPGQFHPVPIGIAKVDRLADAMIGGALERYLGGQNAVKGFRQRRS